MPYLKSLFGALTLSAAILSAASADEVKIVNVDARKTGDSWTFSVTLRHKDTGWDHYADQWQVFSSSGELLGSRELAHPHVNEQPFTRSLSGVRVPEDVSEVIIRARDNVHGVSTQEYRLTLK